MNQIEKEELTPQEEKYLKDYNIKFSKARSEFEDDKENKELSKILNKTAYCIVTAVVVIVLAHFVYLLVNKTSLSFTEGIMLNNDRTEQINLQNSNIDDQTILVTLKKIQEVEKSIIQKEADFKDDARFLIVVVGSIFAVVGFFGFKSIFDTRQAAVEKAVIEAKESAKTKASEVAEKTAKETAKETAEKTIEELAPNLIQDLTKKYIDDMLPEHFTKLEKTLTDNLSSDISTLEEEIDKINNPLSFPESQRPRIAMDLQNYNEKINKELEDLKAKEELFRTKFDRHEGTLEKLVSKKEEILSNINDIQKVLNNIIEIQKDNQKLKDDIPKSDKDSQVKDEPQDNTKN